MAGQSAKARSIGESTKKTPTLRSASSGTNQVPTVAYSLSMDSKASWFRERTGTLLASAAHNTPVVATHDQSSYIVRKLLPVECERLQGFPDGWTDIMVDGEPVRDSMRYGALGNAVTVNIMRWIGQRLNAALETANAKAA